MDTNIKEWIGLARKLTEYLLSSPDEKNHQEAEDWCKQSARHKNLLQYLSDPRTYTERIKQQEKIQEKYSYDEFVHAYKQQRRMKRLRWTGYAASVIFLLTVGGIGWWQYQKPVQIVATISPEFTPGSAKASLILENGQEIPLDNSLVITEEDGTLIQNNEQGELAYRNTSEKKFSDHYNTLRIPRGGEYRLTLADGTRVWLNSESELTYPTQFNGSKREVILKGEAYFEIASNKQQPFYVKSHNIQVHATGTAFNVMAYEDETTLQVTLTEGGVNIEQENTVLSHLTPDMQFAMNKENGQYLIKNVDPRIATAWKNGIFFFDNEPLSSIIRKLSRWYEADIECKTPELYQYKFSGEIRKYENISRVLDMLSLTNEITYTIDPNHKISIHAAE